MAEEDEKYTAFAGDMLLVNKYAPEKSREMAQANDDSVQKIRFAKIVICRDDGPPESNKLFVIQEVVHWLGQVPKREFGL